MAVLRPADRVVVTQLHDETVLLDLDTERYFGLDPTAARMWRVLCEAASIEDACAVLVDEFDVDPAILERDVVDLVERLAALGLAEVPS